MLLCCFSSINWPKSKFGCWHSSSQIIANKWKRPMSKPKPPTIALRDDARVPTLYFTMHKVLRGTKRSFHIVALFVRGMLRQRPWRQLTSMSGLLPMGGYPYLRLSRLSKTKLYTSLQRFWWELCDTFLHCVYLQGSYSCQPGCNYQGTKSITCVV